MVDVMGGTCPQAEGVALQPVTSDSDLRREELPQRAGSQDVNAAFREHWNAKRVPLDRLVMLLFLVLHAVSALKNWHIYIAHPGFALGWPVALATCLQWAGAVGGARGGYARWRELPAVLIPLAGCLTACTWEVSAKALADVSVWQEGSALSAPLFWFALLFGSMSANVMVAGLAWPKRLALHCTAQAAYCGLLLRRVPGICAAPLLQHPASQRQVGAVHAALRACGRALVGRAAMSFDAPHDVQCGAVVSAFVVMLCFVLPVALGAAWERDEFESFIFRRRSAAATPGDWLAAAGRRGVYLELRQLAVPGILALLLLLMVWDTFTCIYSRGV